MTKTSTFHVSGLCCAAEEATIRKRLESQKGVHGLTVHIVTKKIEVRHSCPENQILQSLKEIGLPGTSGRSVRREKPARSLLFQTLAGAALFIAGLILFASGAPALVATVSYLSAIVVSGWRIALRAVKAVRSFSLDMNFLMTIAVIGAVAIGEHAEGAAVIVLFAVSLLLEALATDRSRRAIESLMNLSPPTATIRVAGSETVVPVEDVATGQTIIIRPGERVPLDGVILDGSSSVDQSAITGESIPVGKNAGDAVYAGSINQRGALEVRVSKAAGDSTIARIVQLVEEAQAKKAPSQTFIERFARTYTPAVFFLAIGVAILPPFLFEGGFETWFYRALVLLVIACPCALVISTPVSVINAVTHAARKGVLIKGGIHLEHLAGVRAIAVDKTGTITTGQAVVTDIVRLNSVSSSEIVRISAALEAHSEHHLADAFLKKAEAEGIPVLRADIGDFEALPGKGVRATVDGTRYTLGNHPLMEELRVCTPELEGVLDSLERQGKTAVVLADDRGPVGVIGIADEVRREGRKTIEDLHGLGVSPIVLLTGDNRGTAESVGAALGVDEVRPELLPEHKLAAVRKLKNTFGPVAMVGDGINDAPALAAADVGIAMGGVGSDTALETADVVLMSDDLLHIPYSIRLGKRALAIIKQNIVIALTTKAVFLILGVLGMTSLWLAILADDGATLVVVLNSMRLLSNKG
ncbi:MAG: cadmium-translocating P-type ATPase [Ignavibacteriales bacterium]|nr:cadmium-translocating P-type ATPase [Ignavibacteriales bacterium]